MKNLVLYKGVITKYYLFFIVPFIFLYVLINIFDGNNGLLAHKYLDHEISSLKNQIASIQSENGLLEIKINSIKSNHNNEDLLDEHVRSVLGYGKINEYTLYFE
tara:strand:+ start:1466 stop:1777 length:312 start_codon:yes stop_codon:yes gene_type:complete